MKGHDYAHARASSAFSSKDNRTVLLTRQDFIPDRTAEGDLLFTFSLNNEVLLLLSLSLSLSSSSSSSSSLSLSSSLPLSLLLLLLLSLLLLLNQLIYMRKTRANAVFKLEML